MATKYVIKFNGVILMEAVKKKTATDFLKLLNKKHSRILSIVKEIEEKGGQVFGTIYLDKEEGDYIYPVKTKRI